MKGKWTVIWRPRYAGTIPRAVEPNELDDRRLKVLRTRTLLGPRPQTLLEVLRRSFHAGQRTGQVAIH